MALRIGGIDAYKVTIDGISGARRRLNLVHRALQSSAVLVDFHITVPASVGSQAASLVAAVDTSSLIVAGAQASGTITPVVTSPPDVNCVGLWSTCASDCSDQSYSHVSSQSNQGAECAVAAGMTRACEFGVGLCRAPPPPPRSCADRLASGSFNPFDCDAEALALDPAPSFVDCGSGCTAMLCCTATRVVAPVSAAAATPPPAAEGSGEEEGFGWGAMILMLTIGFVLGGGSGAAAATKKSLGSPTKPIAGAGGASNPTFENPLEDEENGGSNFDDEK